MGSFYELGSTHPLTALRVRALNTTAEEMQMPVAYALPSDQRVRWGSFPFEVFVWAAPAVCIAVALLGRALDLDPRFTPWLLLIAGITWAARIAFRYRGDFIPQTTEAYSTTSRFRR